MHFLRNYFISYFTYAVHRTTVKEDKYMLLYNTLNDTYIILINCIYSSNSMIFTIFLVEEHLNFIMS